MTGRPNMTPSKAIISGFLDTFSAVGSLEAPHQCNEGEWPWPDHSPTTWMTCSWSVLFKGHDNDPSAGSPTKTLLQLLLPLMIRFNGLLATSGTANCL